MSEKRDYYEVLSVERGASADEMRKAYKREALKQREQDREARRAVGAQ